MFMVHAVPVCAAAILPEGQKRLTALPRILKNPQPLFTGALTAPR
jgi:hypothetical protein